MSLGITKDLMRKLLETGNNEKQLFDVVIAHWAQLSIEPWDDNFGVEISGFPLEQLLTHIEEYQNLRKQLKNAQVKIDILKVAHKEQKKSPSFVSALQSLIT